MIGIRAVDSEKQPLIANCSRNNVDVSMSRIGYTKAIKKGIRAHTKTDINIYVHNDLKSFLFLSL